MVRRILQGRALYIILLIGLAVLIFAAKDVPLDVELATELSQFALTEEAIDPLQEVDIAAIQQAIIDKPEIGISLSILTCLVIGMIGIGSFISLRSIISGNLQKIWHHKSKQIIPWKFRDLWRIIFLAAYIILLTPFARLVLLNTWPDITLDANFWITVSMFWIDGFVLLTILAFAVGRGWSGRDLLGSPGAISKDSIFLGIRGYVAVFPWLLGILWLIVNLWEYQGWEIPVQPIQELIFSEDRLFVVILTGALACLIGPIVEEFFFRGLLYGALRQRTGRISAMLISSLLFSGMHGTMVGLVPIVLLGCLLAYLYERTGTIVVPMVVHIAHNSLLMLGATLMRQLPGI